MINVPPSVLAYYQQRDVEMAVELMVSLGKKVPDVRGWSEVPLYYRSWLAAHQTRAEFALFLEEVWRSVWEDRPAGWVPRDPNHPDRPDLSISIETVWDEGCFSRRFEQGDYALELSGGLWSDECLQLGVLLYDAEEDVALDDRAMAGWAMSQGFDTFWTGEEIVAMAPVIDLAPFKPRVQRAWEAIEMAIGKL